MNTHTEEVADNRELTRAWDSATRAYLSDIEQREEEGTELSDEAQVAKIVLETMRAADVEGQMATVGQIRANVRRELGHEPKWEELLQQVLHDMHAI